jgi:hypothetical protein
VNIAMVPDAVPTVATQGSLPRRDRGTTGLPS